ncbi:MAG TPA: cytochrome c3 family protein [Chitinophagaceae bacterium]|nr:cytochrome c3 family protein [Chitinophagaceae bacterium]
MGVDSLFKTKKMRAFTVLCIVAALVFTSFQTVSAQDADKGKTLFQTNCASCHNPVRDMTGPALKGVVEDIPGGMDWVYDWVHNSSKVIASGDEYANKIFKEWGQTQMTHFPQLSTEDIDNIFAYVDNFEPAGSPTAEAAAQGTGAPAKGGGSSALLFGIISLVLAVVVLILWQANKHLGRIANDKEGVPNYRKIPFYLKKRNISVVVIVLFFVGGYLLVEGATTIGYSKNYTPKQPIFYSHKVHAGINQINCLYCHAGAEKSRMAMIPSPNICMNCHEVINEYTGNTLQDMEGNPVDGTAEIQKLYEYAGWDPDKKEYTEPAKPIEWTKVHNLPDYVYFNHSQHVKVGQIQCQTCHGEIQKMDEVHQHATLGMGWCVNCHRDTKVQFKDNGYYTIFSKYQEQIKAHKIDSVTVEMQGGTDCAKCHY